MRTHVLRLAPAVLVALILTQLTTKGWPIWPWHPRLMDLMVYQHGGRLVAGGGDLLQTPDPHSAGLVFTYPPFAALLAVPMSYVPTLLLGVLWIGGTAVALYATLRRFGLDGWPLVLVTTIGLVVIEPLRSTLHFGQINVFLMAMVALDLLRRPGRPPGRWQGILTGLAAAIKLTPALFIVYLLFARRWRAAANATATALVATLVGWIVLPEASREFWSSLAAGDNRTGYLSNLVNQSILGAWSRLAEGHTLLVMGVAGLVGLAGAWAAGRWDRFEKPGLALVVCASASLMASPVSWNHHFVWVLPLAVVLLTDRDLPRIVRITGLAFAGWAAAGLYKFVGDGFGHGEEATYHVGELTLGGLTAILGTVFIASALWSSRDSR